MKKNRSILMVIAPNDFRDEELFEPKRVFEENGWDVKIASTSTDTAQGMLGGSVKPDMNISDADAKDYSAIVISGGTGSKKYLWGREDIKALVKNAYDNNKIVAAICISPVVLARAGLLKDKESTVFPDKECLNELKTGGAVYVDENVVVSRGDRIVTANGPKSATKFALKILEILNTE